MADGLVVLQVALVYRDYSEVSIYIGGTVMSVQVICVEKYLP